jgi:hypothetical protein
LKHDSDSGEGVGLLFILKWTALYTRAAQEGILQYHKRVEHGDVLRGRGY